MCGADTILEELRAGNARYVHVRSAASPDAGYRSVPEHQPRAVVVGCSDARVPVEQVFDQAPGSLFVVRVAGHVLEPAALASILYAVRELGVRLVIVLGHQACGAVRAAIAAGGDNALSPLVDPIAARLRRTPEAEVSEDEAIAANARAAMAEVSEFLRTSLPDLAQHLTMRCAVKALDTGEVTWLEREERV
jgi:carbonic anhydrase